jgi:hypothetical protein
MQVCPVAAKTPARTPLTALGRTPLTALGRSASGKMMLGDLPPSSRDTRAGSARCPVSALTAAAGELFGSPGARPEGRMVR